MPLSRLEKPSVVAASLVQTLSWRDRRAKKIVKATRREYDETLLRLLPLMGATELIDSILKGN